MEYVSSAEMFELVHGRRTDDPAWFTFGDAILEPDSIVEMLAPQISDTRKQTIERVLRSRTRNVTVVVDGMVDLGNVSAVMRTADGFGVQSVHAIDTADTYKRSRRTTRGADKWLDRYRWADAKSCCDHLRSEGFRIVAADLGEDGVPIHDVDLTEPTAFVFGNELEGISPEARREADMAITIPMSGFADSFNISVAASMVLYETRRQREMRLGSMGDLSGEDLARIRAVWYLKSVRESHLFVERALADRYGAAGTV